MRTISERILSLTAMVGIGLATMALTAAATSLPPPPWQPATAFTHRAADDVCDPTSCIRVAKNRTTNEFSQD